MKISLGELLVLIDAALGSEQLLDGPGNLFRYTREYRGEAARDVLSRLGQIGLEVEIEKDEQGV